MFELLIDEQEPRHAPVVFALRLRSNLKCFYTEIIKIYNKTVKHIVVCEIYVTVEVIKRKPIIVILKEQKGFRARVLVKNLLNALRSLGGNAATPISRLFQLLNRVNTSIHVYVYVCLDQCIKSHNKILSHS